MKTSNILFTTAIVVFLGYLLSFNLGLRKQYLNIQKIGIVEYNKQNRFNDYEKINVKSFTNIDLKAANALNVRIEYGKEPAIYIGKTFKGKVQFTVSNNSLAITPNKNWDENHHFYNDAIVVISPLINEVTTSEINLRGKFEGLRNSFSGFNQDSLILNVAGGTELDLTDNKIKTLRANVGNPLRGGSLFIGASNMIESLKLFVQGNSNVELLSKDIKQFEHHISDSSSVTLSGSALNAKK